MVNKETHAMTIHKTTPCKKGFIPTDFITSFERPDPIRNKTTTTPRLATILTISETGASIGKYVLSNIAAKKRIIK